MYEHIPEALKENEPFCLWKRVCDKKVPYQVSGMCADASDPSTFAGFDDVVATYTDYYDGIGVLTSVFTKIDIDDCVTDGKLTPFAEEIVSAIDSYTEFSPSGTGIHIICYTPGIAFDRERYYINNRKIGMEVYIPGATDRFFTVTGKVYRGNDIKERTEQVQAILEKYMQRNMAVLDVPNIPQRDEADLEAAAFDIVTTLRQQKNGDKFRKLYDDGDITGYGSHSEADLALVNLILFRTGEDVELIDYIFRGSSLYRNKWEREDYRRMTIGTAIKAAAGNYHHSVKETPKFIMFNTNTKKSSVNVPLLAQHFRDNTEYILVRNNGRQGMQKYVYENGCYIPYADNMIMGIIKGYISSYSSQLVKMRDVNEALQHINTDLNYVSQYELNADEGLINFSNGLLRVKADETYMLPHSPRILSTIQIPCQWTDEGKETPVFDSYMATLTDGDKEVENLLLEFIGACLSNVKGWRMKKALFMEGIGDTGKSVLKTLVERLLGKGNFIGIDLKEIEARFGTGAIYGTRLAGSSDMSFLSVDELKTFKKITGGDSLFAEFKGQPGFEFTYDGLLWFCMNKLPRFGGDNGKWVYNRILVIHCPNVIPLEEQDKQLIDKLYAEREGIVYKAIKALQNVIGQGYRFSEPDSIRIARDEYMTENNTVLAFFEECMCHKETADNITTGKIYKAYRAWCHDNNNGYAKTAKEFRDILADHLNSSYKDITMHSEYGTCYRDFTLTKECQEENIFL